VFKLFGNVSQAANVRRCLIKVAVAWIVAHDVVCQIVDWVEVTIRQLSLNQVSLLHLK